MANKNLSQTKFIKAVSEKSGVPTKTVKLVLDAIKDVIYQKMKAGWVIRITDLGVFKKYNRKARIGRNPATGEKIKIPAKTVGKVNLATRLKKM